MLLTPLLAAPGITISYDADNRWLYADWLGEHDQDSSQRCCLLLLEALRAHPCSRILNDNSNITRTSVQLTLWGSWWLDEMLAAGLRHIAWVYPRDFAARQATEAVVRFIQRPVVATFDDVASAYFWLQAQPAGAEGKVR
ncbi:hypothetical protein [Hymenobacter sp. B81]|uniref:hypothetical protein n=1 Tax=Hymenobacter sp. B81 TaxID=3344878 RepID=UPI0037DD9714